MKIFQEEKINYLVHYNGCDYNIYIEAFDGGGRDNEEFGPKKISITSSKVFRELIERGESVLVINEYVPLHYEDNNLVLDDISIYEIIKLEEIYSSKVIRKSTGNASSRWVGLDVMLDALNNHKMVMNNEKNVYVIPSDLISNYFNLKIVDEEYEEMAKYIYEEEKDEIISEEKISRIFRDRLINQRGKKCEFINCNVNISDQLVASHILAKKRIRNDNSLTKEEKFKLMSDPNNGFLLCRVHDALFDKNHITFTDEGELIIAESIRPLAKEYNIEGYDGKKIINVKEESKKYLNEHRKQFLESNINNSKMMTNILLEDFKQ